MQLNGLRPIHILLAVSTVLLSCMFALLASRPRNAHAGAAVSGSSATPDVSTSPAATPAPIQISVTLADFSVKSDPSTVPSGDVTFNVTNRSASPHEFVIMQTDNPPNALLYDNASQKAIEDAPGQNDVGEVGGELPFIASGATESGSFTLTPGKYVLICNIPGHYKLGMYTAFTIGPSAASNAPVAAPSSAPVAASSNASAATSSNASPATSSNADAAAAAPGASNSNSVGHAFAIAGGLGMIFTMMVGCIVFLGTSLRDV